MYFQILKWFFANRGLYLFRGLYFGTFAVTVSIDGARTASIVTRNRPVRWFRC
jgi:hypothetical protein